MAPEHDDQGFAEQLFEAARRERPSELVKQRALRDALRPPRARRPWRWLLIAAAVGAVVTLLVREHDARQPLAAVSAEPSHSSPKPAEAPASVVPQPPLPTPSPSALATVARSAAPKPQPATLEAELALVDHARQALLDRNYDDALATLAQYDKLATKRRLGAEATLLRIQILAATGRAAEASRLASDFVAHDPNNPLVDRAKSFIAPPAEN